MNKRITAIVHTFNEEDNIKKAIESVSWADEVLVCDMYSNDQTVEIARKLGARIIFYKQMGYVEPARNFAVSKVKTDWILILDADEEIPITLKDKILEIIQDTNIDVVEIPRKNIIFNQWIKEAMWWPDYNIRLFRKGKVLWSDKIHSKPKIEGVKLTLNSSEDLAIIHNNYQTVNEYLESMNRYSSIQADEMIASGYILRWEDFIVKPVDEFFSRYFAYFGFKAGLHGLVLSLLQSFSILLIYIKIWERSGFKKSDVDYKLLSDLANKKGKEINWWFKKNNFQDNKFIEKFKRVINQVF